MPVPNPPKNGNNNEKGFNWGRFSKTLSFWILIMLIPVALIQLTGARAEAAPEITLHRSTGPSSTATTSREVTMSGGKNVTGELQEHSDRDARQDGARSSPCSLPMANSQAEVDQLEREGREDHVAGCRSRA